LLDFGMSFGQRGLYYQEYLSPRTFNGVGDLLALGIIPEIDGIYRDDPVGGLAGGHEKPFVDAVLLSHPHADHAGYVALLDGRIPLYATEAAAAVLRAMGESGNTTFENEILTYKYREPGKWQPEERERALVPVADGRPFALNGLETTAYAVDHSVPGAVGYIIRTSAGPVAYTGDFRFHGAWREATERFVRAMARERVRALIIEGTNVDEEDGSDETEVALRISGALRRAEGCMAFCTFAPRDVNRLATFYTIAEEEGRTLVVSHKMAHLVASLEGLVPDLPRLDELVIYTPRRRWGTYTEKEYKRWERRYLTMENSVRARDLSRSPGDYLIYLDFFSLGELIDIQPPPGAVMIHSQTEPFNEEMEFDFERFKNWLRRFGVRYEHAHASGHAYAPDLRRVVAEVEPELLVPVHTENPEAFRGAAREVAIVAPGETIRLG